MLEEERKKRKQFQDLGRKMLGSFSYPVALDGVGKGGTGLWCHSEGLETCLSLEEGGWGTFMRNISFC